MHKGRLDGFCLVNSDSDFTRLAQRLRERFMNASSMESGSTSGMSPSIIARTLRPTAAYFFMSGLTTTASGQALSALNIGMAERTP